MRQLEELVRTSEERMAQLRAELLLREDNYNKHFKNGGAGEKVGDVRVLGCWHGVPGYAQMSRFGGAAGPKDVVVFVRLGARVRSMRASAWVAGPCQCAPRLPPRGLARRPRPSSHHPILVHASLPRSVCVLPQVLNVDMAMNAQSGVVDWMLGNKKKPGAGTAGDGGAGKGASMGRDSGSGRK